MKLLLDENLSRRIVPFIQDLYPDSTQVALIGMEQLDDKAIRQYAIDNGFGSNPTPEQIASIPE